MHRIDGIGSVNNIPTILISTEVRARDGPEQEQIPSIRYQHRNNGTGQISTEEWDEIYILAQGIQNGSDQKSTEVWNKCD